MNFNDTNFEDILIKTKTKKVIKFYMDQHLLRSEKNCETCDKSMYLKISRHFIDKYAWRCFNTTCIAYRKRTSIRKDSFFEGFKINLKKLLRIFLYWSDNLQQKVTL
ncbi:hypothetical protein H311_00097 [Anncaliia algerae PRA109]|nr:hypothetical protein H311_00097 [Anncaliia algerae PRA109]